MLRRETIEGARLTNHIFGTILVALRADILRPSRGEMEGKTAPMLQLSGTRQSNRLWVFWDQARKFWEFPQLERMSRCSKRKQARWQGIWNKRSGMRKDSIMYINVTLDKHDLYQEIHRSNMILSYACRDGNGRIKVVHQDRKQTKNKRLH